jgi:ribose transport system permease protein
MEKEELRNGSGLRDSLLRFVSQYGLLLMLVLTIAVFSLLLPRTFPTAFNFRSILNQQSVVVLLALAAMIPMTANRFDLSIGYMVGLSHILVIGFQVNQHFPWYLAVLAVLGVGAFVGWINGLLVTRIGIDAFIGTLGTGTIVYGIAYWYTGGTQVLGNLPAIFKNIDSILFGLIPSPAIFVLVVALLLWVVFEYLPLGRFLYVLGSSQRAAELTGISARRYIPLTFVASGMLTAVAGVILASELQVGQTAVGPDYLLPSFAGAMLGATSIHPGRMNVWGTIVAVLLLAVAVSGLQQLGGQFYVVPLFNGSMLIVAVSLAIFAAKRRVRRSEPRRARERAADASQANEDSTAQPQ